MSKACPCGLTQEKIIQLKDFIAPTGGFCQHPNEDASGVCGRRIGDHPTEGNFKLFGNSSNVSSYDCLHCFSNM